MLTVRVIRPDGSEWIEEVGSVALNTAKQSLTGRRSVTIFLVGKEQICTDIYEGFVYVMNNNGKTVAAYDLGSEPKTE